MELFSYRNIFLKTISGVVLVIETIFTANLVSGQQILDLKTPGCNEAFSGEKKDSVLFIPTAHSVNIAANMTMPSNEGNVFEGLLADIGGSAYKSSVGEFSNNGTLRYTGTMVNPHTYTQFLVTEEPFEDPDLDSVSVIVGA